MLGRLFPRVFYIPNPVFMTVYGNIHLTTAMHPVARNFTVAATGQHRSRKSDRLTELMCATEEAKWPNHSFQTAQF